jgi:transcription initiation factor TFIID subunit 1, fungi type
MGDNSTAVLFEYSEEHPLMLSSTGMGNNVVNYYRKKTPDDTYRPKQDIGEPTVLLNEDASPFNVFGHVDPGQEVAALLNSMYRAPLFKQPLKNQDFLIVRETTGLEGTRYYLRNVNSSYVVGQELPIRRVPGIHSRNVTTASKNRLRAIAYRLTRRRKNNRIRVEEVTRHFPDSTDMQNRQKMKEFMSYNKEHKVRAPRAPKSLPWIRHSLKDVGFKPVDGTPANWRLQEWEMAQGQVLFTEEQIQGLITPEDIATLEAKDVGAQYLRDVGYADDDAGDDDEDKVGEPFEQSMAPWKITKNFTLAQDNKAMLKLYGEGDPSGRGEAISFLKTSMKGGFRTMGGAINDTVLSKKELGGHTYNVARQEADYKDALRHIWNKQSNALSSREAPPDPTLEGDVDTREDNRQNNRAASIGTPDRRRIDDETGTSFSRRSGTSQQGQKWLKITRRVKDGKGGFKELTYTESDPDVIKAYIRRKQLHETAVLEYARSPTTHGEVANMTCSINSLKPTGDADVDAKNQERYDETLDLISPPVTPTYFLKFLLLTKAPLLSLQTELARLEANQARNKKRASKKKATTENPNPDGDDPGSPNAGLATPIGGGKEVKPTVRKCANCGQVGHIKTNKKYDPHAPKCDECGLGLVGARTQKAQALLAKVTGRGLSAFSSSTLGLGA